MKFEIKNTSSGYELYQKSWGSLIKLGDIELYKEEKNIQSCCHQSEKCFDYHGIKKALCGKMGYRGEYFPPKRILVIQMK